MNKHVATLRNPSTFVIFIISLSLVVLNILRIFHVPLTCDEAGVYFDKTTYADIIQMNIPSANNHILNSLLRKFFVDTFANNFFFIRLDSLIAQAIFLVASYKLCKLLFQKSPWVICSFLLLNLYPLLFEFWGLGRGYGLAIAFMTASIFNIVVYYNNESKISLHVAFVFSLLAVYSNFSLLDYFVGVVGFVIFQPLFFKRTRTILYRTELLSTILYSGILYKLVASPIKKLVAANQLYYGGEKDIVHDTIYSLVCGNLHIPDNDVHHHTLLITTTYFLIILSIVPGLYWIFMYVRNKSRDAVFTGSLLWILFAVPVASTMVMHAMFGTKYLIDRTALFLLVLFAIQFTYWLYFVTQKKSIVGTIVILAFTAAVTYNFVLHTNISSTRLWWVDAYDVTVLDRIVQETRNKNEKNKLCVYWYFEPAIGYYTDGLYSKYFYRIGVARDNARDDTSFDYYYVPGDKVGHIQDNYILDTSYGDNVFLLFKKK